MSATSPATEIDVDTLAQLLTGEVMLIDVREPDEYSDGHIAEAVSMPLAEVAGRIEELPREEAFYVVCAVGHRSAMMANMLRQHGYDAVNVAGGTQAWYFSGRPLA